MGKVVHGIPPFFFPFFSFPSLVEGGPLCAKSRGVEEDLDFVRQLEARFPLFFSFPLS